MKHHIKFEAFPLLCAEASEGTGSIWVAAGLDQQHHTLALGVTGLPEGVLKSN